MCHTAAETADRGEIKIKESKEEKGCSCWQTCVEYFLGKLFLISFKIVWQGAKNDL